MKTFLLKNKRGFTLFELLFSTIIGSIILLSALNILDLLYKENNETFGLTIDKIDFETTRLFLENKIKEDTTLAYLTLNKTTLLYKDSILIQDVVSFTKQNGNVGIDISICKKNQFCTEIYIKK